MNNTSPPPITRARWKDILSSEKGNILGFVSIRGERYGGRLLSYDADSALVRSSGGLNVQIFRSQTVAVMLGGD